MFSKFREQFQYKKISRTLAAVVLLLTIPWHQTVRAEEQSIIGLELDQDLAQITECGIPYVPDINRILFGSYKSFGRPSATENPVDITVKLY